METKRIEAEVLGFQTTKTMDLLTLPPEVLQLIFSFIDASQLLQLKLVCRSFKENCQPLIKLKYEAVRHHLKIFHQTAAYQLSRQNIFFCLNRMQPSINAPNSLDAIHWLYMFLLERMSRTVFMCSHERDAMKTILLWHENKPLDRTMFTSLASELLYFPLQRTYFLTEVDQPFLEANSVFQAKCSFNFIKEEEYRLIIGDTPLKEKLEFDEMESCLNGFINRLVPDLLDSDVRNSQIVSVKEKKMGITILQEMMKSQLQKIYKKIKKNDELHQELVKINTKLNYSRPIFKTHF